MWEPRRLTTLWASIACYKYSRLNTVVAVSCLAPPGICAGLLRRTSFEALGTHDANFLRQEAGGGLLSRSHLAQRMRFTSQGQSTACASSTLSPADVESLRQVFFQDRKRVTAMICISDHTVSKLQAVSHWLLTVGCPGQSSTSTITQRDLRWTK
jgi:hypothetical protein